MSDRSDISDFASHVEQRWVRAAVERVQSEVRHPAQSTECIDCGEPIPQARRQAAPWAKRCVYCQELTERRAG